MLHAALMSSRRVGICITCRRDLYEKTYLAAGYGPIRWVREEMMLACGCGEWPAAELDTRPSALQ